MSKEYLEAFEVITGDNYHCDEETFYHNKAIVEQALQRLEQIDNSDLSEALEEIKTLRGFNQVELNNDKNINKSLDVIEQALLELKSIKEVNPSEALEIIKKYAKNDGWADGWTIEFWNMTEKELTILDKVFKNEIPKTGLMDYNPTKQYLKWEDLEFTNEEQSIQVLLNGKKYTMFYYDDDVSFDTVVIGGVFIDCCDKQFFNDLHLERVEE